MESPDNLADILMYFLPQGVIGNVYALVLVLGTLSVYGDIWCTCTLSLAHRVISPPLSDSSLFNSFIRVRDRTSVKMREVGHAVPIASV